MILVSVYIKEEKLFIEVKHKITYQVEKEFPQKNSTNSRNILLFSHLFISIIKLGVKELLQFRKPGKLHTKISSVPANYIEGK